MERKLHKERERQQVQAEEEEEWKRSEHVQTGGGMELGGRSRL